MVRLRKFKAYRRLERPYTRKSKVTKRNYVRSVPASKIVRYHMGEPKKKYTHTVTLVAKDSLQLRHNAIESARQTTNRKLETTAGLTEYHFHILVYPHHVLRENPLASGAGADRMSTGMAASFGKTISVAAQIHKGKEVMKVYVNKNNIEVAKKALQRGYSKLPGNYAIVVKEFVAKAVKK